MRRPISSFFVLAWANLQFCAPRYGRLTAGMVRVPDRAMPRPKDAILSI